MRGPLAYVADSLFFGVYDCSEAMGREARRARLPEGTLTTCPNPFNDAAIIRFSCEKTAAPQLLVYDEMGRLARDLSSTIAFHSGEGVARWEASGLPSGRYFLSLRAGDYQTRQAVTILK